MRELGQLPLVIGVTGHRDIGNLPAEDRERLKNQVRSFFKLLQRRYPHTPLAILSSLAEGADRMVAQVARELDLRLIAPLPLPAAEYSQDFPDSVAEFNDLVKEATPSFVVVSPDLPSPSRPECYAMVGGYLARHCQILLALWDGEPGNGVGGTEQVVEFKEQGVPFPYGPKRDPLDPAETGPVYQLVTPRPGKNPPARAFELIRREPISNDLPAACRQVPPGKVWDRIFWWTNTFNRDCVRLKDMLAETRRKSVDYVFSEPVRGQLPPTVVSGLVWYSYADSLAQHCQKLTRRFVLGMLIIAFLMAVTFQIYSFITDPPQWLAWTYLAFFSLGLVGYGWVRYGWWTRFGGRCQDKFLDYRALAEGLRVHLFWRLAGVGRSVSDDYLRKFHSELDWIRQAIRVWTIPASGAAMSGMTPRPEFFQTVLDHWVEDQEGFFARRAQSNQRMFLRFRLLGIVLFVVSFVLTVIKVFVSSESLILLLMNWTLVIAGLFLLWSQIEGYAEHAQQYSRMAGFFMRGRLELKRLIPAGRDQEVTDLLRDLGQEALIENGDWLLLHRARRIHLPGL